MRGGNEEKGKKIASAPTGGERYSLVKAKVVETSRNMVGTQPSMSFDGTAVEFGSSQGGGFVIGEDMEHYLWRPCRNLGLGCPVFERKVFYDVNGNIMFGFSTKLRCEDKGVEVDFDGCFLTDEFMAREDAAFKLLGRLLR
ncbi:hypothetical protein PIB30_006354 [Stylosanthes scabra]|uniref:Peptidase A1 domain-containing protein n=1 Tax=Stylosanthes scabra TaxID=79078 RepID=A0ABU6S4I9_9FABA|nr:hypothetical protein [Stylosanthes scabra]